MLNFTLIANKTNPVLYMEIQGNEQGAINLLTELFTGNPDGTIPSGPLTASSSFKERLNQLDVFGERSYKLKSFLNNIPTDHHFFLISKHIDDRILIFLYIKRISDMDGEPIDFLGSEKLVSYLYNNYELRFFHGEERMNIGVYNKSQRVCRFCGKSIPEVSFKQKAHAISESLGNKGLICYEECDECNKRFSEQLEQDISNYFRLPLIIKGVKGKKGSPTMKGDNISIAFNSVNLPIIENDAIVLKAKNMPRTNDPQEIAKFLTQNFLFSSVRYKSQNIYKCFCKYALSLLDSRYLTYFKNTIEWINEPPTKHRLPPLWCYNAPNGDSPSMTIMTRKHNHRDLPYCWAIMSIADTKYIFIIPFCSLDKYKFVNKKRVNHFLDTMKMIMPNVNLRQVNFSSINPQSIMIKSHFEISPNCVEGKDYYFIDSKSSNNDTDIETLDL